MMSVNLFKSCNFVIQLAKQKQIEFYVQESILPDVNIGEIEMPNRWQNFKIPGDNINWGVLTLTLVCDEDLLAYKDLINLIMKYKNPKTGDIDIEDNLFTSYLFLTTNKNNVKHQIEFVDCWVQSISSLTLSSTTSEDDIITFTVDIMYSYYEWK